MRGSAPAWIHSVGPLALADLRHRYAGSVLGGLWAVVGPLVEVAAFAFVFGLLLRPESVREGVSYALYVAAGLLPWASLREALEGSATTLADNRWVRRSRVPLELLVARQALAGAARGAVGLALVLLTGAAWVEVPSAAALLLPWGALALQTLAAYGVGLGLAPLAALHPDLRPALASALTLLTFASPILYPEAALAGGQLARLIEWNPFTHYLRFYRLPLGTALPSALDFAVVAATPLLLLGVGALLKQRFLWAARDRL